MMASKPCLCMERLWRVPTAPLVDSRSLVWVIALTRASTILWLFMMSWGTIMAAWLTTTCRSRDQLRDGPGGQVYVILIFDQVDHGMLQHLAGLGGVQLGGGDLQTFIQSLREHGGSEPLTPGLIQLLVHLDHLLLGVPRLGKPLVHVEDNMLLSPGIHVLVHFMPVCECARVAVPD